MPRSRLDRVKRLELGRTGLVGPCFDVTEMTDRQLEEVVGIPGLSAAMDRMSPAETERFMNLLLQATEEAIAECCEIVTRMAGSAV